MKGRSLEETAAELAKLSPRDILRSRDAMEKAIRARTSRADQARLGALAADDATVRFELRFVDDDVALNRVKDVGWAKQQGKRRIALLPKLTQRDLEAMREQRALLIQWLGQKEQNAAIFLADPVAALQSAGARLDENLITRIRESRSRQLAFARVPTGVRVSSIRIRRTGATGDKPDTAPGKPKPPHKTRKDPPAIKPPDKGKYDEYQ